MTTPRRPVVLLTVTEVAAKLRVSKMSIYRLIHGEEIPAIRVGRSFRIPVRGLDRFIANATTIEDDRPAA